MASDPTPPPQVVASLPAYPIDFGSIRSMIEYRFTVLDAFVAVNGMPTFFTALEPMKEKFQELLHDLANHGLTAKIRKVSDKLAISVFPKTVLGKPRRFINLIMLLATIGTVAYASYSVVFSNLDAARAVFPDSNLMPQVIALAVSILGIVAIHETGHVLAVRHHKMDATLPYFVPAPPPIGTFGAVISLRGPPGNRDQLFDLGFSGPIAGFIATVMVGIFVLLTSPMITTQQAETLLSAKVLSPVAWPNVPLLLELLQLAGLGTVPPDRVLVFTNVFFAVQIGAIITFLNILPVWQLDGGHISRATFGDRGHKLMALIGFGVLALAGYWGFAILLILFMFLSRRPLEGVEPLDDVSSLSKSRKALFAVALAMLVLSFVIL